MRDLYIIIILCFSLLFLPLSKEDINNNPKKIDNELESNPINYIIVIEEHNINDENIILKYYDSYLFTRSLLLITDQSKHKFLLVENKLYSFVGEGEHYFFSLVKTIPSDVQYTGYLALKEFIPDSGLKSLCTIQKNEILFYGKEGEHIHFYFILNNETYAIKVGDIDENISCKYYYRTICICVFSQNRQVIIKILIYRYDSYNKKILLEKLSQNISNFCDHDNGILYDTSVDKIKILCARKLDLNNIECIQIIIDNSLTYIDFLGNSLDILKTSFSFEEDNCNYIKLEDEYLLCCGSIGIIKCERRSINDFQLKNYFDINLEGKITNLTLESDGNFKKIIYYNNKTNEPGMYEYLIYNPDC